MVRRTAGEGCLGVGGSLPTEEALQLVLSRSLVDPREACARVLSQEKCVDLTGSANNCRGGQERTDEFKENAVDDISPAALEEAMDRYISAENEPIRVLEKKPRTTRRF